MSGVSLRLRGNIASNAIPKIRGFLLGLELPTEKLLLYLILSFKSLNVRLRLSEDDMMKLVHDVIGVNTPLPDAVDLVDELGIMAHTLGLIDQYDNIPFIRRLVDSLHLLAKCSFEFGIFSEDANASIQVDTEGVKELFDLIMAGMEESDH